MTTQDYQTRDHVWQQLQSTFHNFHDFRDLEGVWNLIRSARMPPDVHPDLAKYAQGLRYMSGKLEDDVRILKILHTANPTRFNAVTRGSTQAARDLERDHKLCFASWWDNDLNVGRWLDSFNYEEQITHGCAVNRIKWKREPEDMEDESTDRGCPITIEDVLLDSMWWQGDFRNPDVAVCRYSLSVIDCDVKNARGERPGYTDRGELGWVSEDLPQNYWSLNAGKMIDVVIEDAVDPLAMCPCPGCNHRKRRITTYICKPGAKAESYEEVDCSDSPFEKCSFVIVGGDVRKSERDPHRILRPSAWILYDLVLQYNFLFNSLIATYARELADDRNYVNAGATNPEILQALSPEDDGQGLQKPDDPDTIAKMPGAVQSFPKPSTQELMNLLDKIEREYTLRRPNPALTGQMALSEVTGTGAVLQTQGAGLMLAEDLSNYDSAMVRFHSEIVHGIKFTSYFEPDDKQTRYTAMVSGSENVSGSRGGTQAGDELYLDAKKCEKPVFFSAETSKDTPADRRDREERARTARKDNIFTDRMVWEAYDITDTEMHEEELLRQRLDAFMGPMEDRRVAALIVARSAAITGVDMGEETQTASLPLPKGQGAEGGQSYNTLDANASRLHTPPVEVAPTGNNGAGGSSGLA